jgi:hypothetical protein
MMTIILIILLAGGITAWTIYNANKFPKYKRVRWYIIGVVGHSWNGVLNEEDRKKQAEVLAGLQSRYNLSIVQAQACLVNVYDEGWFRSQSFLKENGTQV